MLLIRSRPVRPPGAPTMCTPRGCVGAPVRVGVRVVVSCARGCTRVRVGVRVSVRLSVRVVVWRAPECTRGGLACA